MTNGKKKKDAPKVTSCDLCQYYIYDEETDDYFCSVNLDEDDMVRFLTSSNYACPYFVLYDEYKIVRKQN